MKTHTNWHCRVVTNSHKRSQMVTNAHKCTQSTVPAVTTRANTVRKQTNWHCHVITRSHTVSNAHKCPQSTVRVDGPRGHKFGQHTQIGTVTWSPAVTKGHTCSHMLTNAHSRLSPLIVPAVCSKHTAAFGRHCAHVRLHICQESWPQPQRVLMNCQAERRHN